MSTPWRWILNRSADRGAAAPPSVLLVSRPVPARLRGSRAIVSASFLIRFRSPLSATRTPQYFPGRVHLCVDSRASLAEHGRPLVRSAPAPLPGAARGPSPAAALFWLFHDPGARLPPEPRQRNVASDVGSPAIPVYLFDAAGSGLGPGLALVCGARSTRRLAEPVSHLPSFSPIRSRTTPRARQRSYAGVCALSHPEPLVADRVRRVCRTDNAPPGSSTPCCRSSSSVGGHRG